MTTTDFSPIKRWFKDKALKTVEDYVLPTLAVAEEQGYWPKGASRKVRAALNKQSVAISFARSNDRRHEGRAGRPDDSELEGLLGDVNDDRKHWYQAKRRGAALVHAMMFGQVGHAPALVPLCRELVQYTRTPHERAALDVATQWVAHFAPVAELLVRLDATRPKPVIVLGSLSRTVVNNLGKTMGIALDRIESPPLKGEWVEMPDPKSKTGQKIRVWVVTILWPEGTKHNVSRFAHGSRAGNEQCHACGHAIRDPWNWIPLLAHGWDAQTSDHACDNPISLWVGRDCARKLFAVDVTGDALYRERLSEATASHVKDIDTAKKGI